jgi:hypothetical protein
MPDPHDNDKQAKDDDLLIVRYLDGQLDEQQFAELNDRLKDEPALRHRLIDLSLHAHHLQAFLEKPDLALVQEALLNQGPGKASVKLSLPMSYRIGLVAAVAAVLALAVTLVTVMTGGEQSSNAPDTATLPDQTSPIRATVATITAEHNAQWAQASLARGSQLRAGQRLTLTAGFAEITTEEGAVVILEAPATIELLDNNNALRLHAGKLVGICETESSKGFLVRTPHMDITDLGTRFGVDASDASTTEVHVFQGEIEVTRVSGNPGAPHAQRLVQGQGVRVDPKADVFVSIPSKPQQFIAHLQPAETTYGATGLGYTSGQVDPAWTVTQINDQPLDTARSMHVLDDERIRHLGPQQAQWISLQTNGLPEASGQSVRYIIEGRLILPGHKGTDRLPLFLNFLADNELVSLTVNGQAVDVPENDLLSGPSLYSIRIEPEVLGKEVNTFRLEIKDLPTTSRETLNYVGFRAAWHFGQAPQDDE